MTVRVDHPLECDREWYVSGTSSPVIEDFGFTNPRGSRHRLSPLFSFSGPPTSPRSGPRVQSQVHSHLEGTLGVKVWARISPYLPPPRPHLSDRNPTILSRSQRMGMRPVSTGPRCSGRTPRHKVVPETPLCPFYCLGSTREWTGS